MYRDGNTISSPGKTQHELLVTHELNNCSIVYADVWCHTDCWLNLCDYMLISMTLKVIMCIWNAQIAHSIN